MNMLIFKFHDQGRELFERPLYNCEEWAKRFREGRESLEDEERIGRPRSAVTSSNTSEIRWRVEEDPHILLRS